MVPIIFWVEAPWGISFKRSPRDWECETGAAPKRRATDAAMKQFLEDISFS
jgi:hypothetical protein